MVGIFKMKLYTAGWVLDHTDFNVWELKEVKRKFFKKSYKLIRKVCGSNKHEYRKIGDITHFASTPHEVIYEIFNGR